MCLWEVGREVDDTLTVDTHFTFKYLKFLWPVTRGRIYYKEHDHRAGGSGELTCTCYFPGVRNIELAFPCLCDDYCEMSGCRGRSHGTSVAQDCVSLKDSHVDFLFKHAR